MILNTYSKISHAGYGAHSTASVGAQYGFSPDETTLDDILACCAEILAALRGRGFRREKPSRKELMDKLLQVQTEAIDIRRELKHIRLMGGKDASK
jgi:hypothetical protein